MKKLIVITVLGLCLICNTVFAKEIILNCYKMETGIDSIEAVRAKVYGNKIDSEIDLNKKILHFDGNKLNCIALSAL